MAIRAFSLAAVAAALLVVHPSAQQTFKVTTNTVALYATVTDGDKRLVPGLVQEDFEVFDNGKPVQITSFDNRPQPITAIVMLDTSGSMTVSLDLVKRAAEQFLIRLLPEDVAKVGAFNDKIEFHPADFTSDRDELISLLKELDFGYPTRLYDAVDESITKLSGIQGRKVVLVFTDGADTASKIGGGKATDRARNEDVMVYSIGLENVFFNGQRREKSSPDRGLKRLSEETGGGYFLLKGTDELTTTFTRVAEELHSQYLIGFPSAADGKVHKVDVRVKTPGTNVRARKSYLAAAATK